MDDPLKTEETPVGELPGGVRPIVGVSAPGGDPLFEAARRLELYIESGIKAGIQWATFEPNAEPLWAALRLSVGAFLQNLFLQGSFAGTTPQQAYFVKCDAENNPQSSLANGIVNITVGFAPLYPAEFVIIQIQQMTC